MAFSLTSLKQPLLSSSNLLLTSLRRRRPAPSVAASLSSSSRLFSSQSAPPRPFPREFQSISAAETDEKLYLRVLMPGVAKEDVDIRVEGHKVIVHGERKRKEPYESSVAVHSCSFGLDEKMFETSQIKALMKHGVLKLVVPKVKKVI